MWRWIVLTLASGAFAVSSLSAAPAAARLVEVKEPAKVKTYFTADSSIRIVNVWATWCIPCVEEMGDLREIAKTFAPRVSVVGVSLDDMIPGERVETKKHVVQFLQSKKVTFPNIYYTGNSDALGELLQFDGEIPITIAFDRNGKELWRHQGKLNRQQTVEAIRKLLRRN
jgi:thiol-disulfide isomerase/thioredoxin